MPPLPPPSPRTLRPSALGASGLRPGPLRSGTLLPGILLSALLFAGCGGGDSLPGEGSSLVQRFLDEAESASGDAAPPADLSQPPVPGWTMLHPACPFPLRLQVPPGWALEEGPASTNRLTLQRDRMTTATLGISMVGGDAAVGDRIREVEANDPSVVRLAEVRYGSRTVPVHGGAERQFVRAYPAVADWGVALQMAVVELRPERDGEGGPLVDEETLARIAATLEPNGC